MTKQEAERSRDKVINRLVEKVAQKVIETLFASLVTRGIFGDSQSGKKTGNLWGFLGFWL